MPESKDVRPPDHLPSFEELRKTSRKEDVGAGRDIDLARPETWLNELTLRPMFQTTKTYWVLVLTLGSIVAWGLACWIYQIYKGMGVTDLRHPLFWGLYISTFVFWVGVSHSGTMVSSILRLVRANWRRPILRGAEAMTAFSLMVAGMFPLIHMGRVWRFYYMIPLPNQRQLWPNFRSPLTWDMTAISVYLLSAMTFLYVGLLPDIALARDMCPGGNWRKGYLTFLALGWRGRHRQWIVYERASILLAILVLMIAPSVHTIVSWDFAMSLTPGWHTSIFGPYFVVGAIYSGIAAVITLMVLLRLIFNLDDVIRRLHLERLSKMLLMMAIIWTYFYFTEFITTWYAHKPIEYRIWEYQWERFPHLLIVMLGTAVLAIASLSLDRLRKNQYWLLFISLMVNVSMFIERYLIVIPPLSHRDDPFTWTDYFPSPVEISIAVAAAAYFVMLYAVFTKLLPIVTVADIREGKVMTGNVRVGNAVARVYADMESRGHKFKPEPRVEVPGSWHFHGDRTVLGLFEHVDNIAKTIEPLEKAGVPHRDISLISDAPYPDGTLFLEPSHPPIWKYTFIGGVIGFVIGLALAGGTQVLMNLNVGGKDPFSNTVVGLICYETTLLCAVLGTLAGLLRFSGLPNWTDQAYDADICRGRVGLLVRCDYEEQVEAVEAIMKDHEAVKIKKGEGDF